MSHVDLCLQKCVFIRNVFVWHLHFPDEFSPPSVSYWFLLSKGIEGNSPIRNHAWPPRLHAYCSFTIWSYAGEVAVFPPTWIHNFTSLRMLDSFRGHWLNPVCRGDEWAWDGAADCSTDGGARLPWQRLPVLLLLWLVSSFLPFRDEAQQRWRSWERGGSPGTDWWGQQIAAPSQWDSEYYWEN